MGQAQPHGDNGRNAVNLAVFHPLRLVTMDILPTLPVAASEALAPSSTIARLAVAPPDTVPDPDRTRGLRLRPFVSQ